MGSSVGSEDAEDPRDTETQMLDCVPGRETIALARSSELAPPSPGDTPPGGPPRAAPPRFESTPTVTRIGRFTVLERVGRGGMGTVYAAYDEELDRKVAVKLLHAHDLSDPQARLRFQREAQALARLSHPNVVTVHEVGHSDGEVFLAMEFVRGQNLDAWIRTEPDWRPVLEVFTQAGQGLVAAHEAGLIHRDLKPHNIMRGEDGVVKVLDFGLARTADGPSEVEPRPETHATGSGPRSGSTLGSLLTRTGTIMGTPAYMSPEQFRGEAVDVRSDQFSFCVAFYEALYGTRPFSGDTVTELQRSVLQADFAAPPPKGGVPSWLHRIVLRGLSPEPAGRWPSMTALLEALSREQGDRRNRWLLGAMGAGVLSVGGVALQTWTHARAQPCTGAAEQLAGVWDQARRTEVERAILGIDRAYANDVWVRMQRDLDGYANDWITMHTETCEATAVHGEQSPQMLDIRMRCLHRAAVDLQATVDTLAQADVTAVNNAHKLTGDLRALSRCADTEALAVEVEPPLPDEAEAVESARMHVARAKSLAKAGLYGAAQAAIDAAKDALVGVEYEPVQTEVALQEGKLFDRLGKYDASERALNEALALGSKWKQWEIVSSAALHLMYVVGYAQQRMEEGLQYRSLVEGLSFGDQKKRARLHNNLGIIFKAQGKREEAEAELRISLSLHEKTSGPESPYVTAALQNLAAVLRAQGKYEEAEARLRTTLSLLEKAFGPQHPRVAFSRHNLANVLSLQGKYEEAEAQLRIALSLMEKAVDARHPNVALSRTALGIVLDLQGEPEEAEAQLRMALAVQNEVLGPEHPDLAFSLNGLGNALSRQGKHEEAAAKLRMALSLRLEALGPGHPDLALSQTDLARTLLALDRAAEALPLAKQAWARRQSHDMLAEDRAQTAFVLAQILWAVEGRARDRPRAQALAEDALPVLRAAGEAYDQDAAQCQQWLDSHRLP